jgi:hypothetical protein
LSAVDAKSRELVSMIPGGFYRPRPLALGGGWNRQQLPNRKNIASSHWLSKTQQYSNVRTIVGKSRP